MLPDRVSNPGPLTYESGALQTALCGPSKMYSREIVQQIPHHNWRHKHRGNHTSATPGSPLLSSRLQSAS